MQPELKKFTSFHDFGALDRTYTGNHMKTFKERVFDVRESLVEKLIHECGIAKEDIQFRLVMFMRQGRSYITLDGKYSWEEVSEIDGVKLTLKLVPCGTKQPR